MNLHIRISDTDICFACYDMTAGGAPHFKFQPYHVRPQASLTVNLRLAMQQIELLQQSYERAEVYVNAPVTPIPLVEFQEEDVDTTYNFCFSPDVKRRVFYDSVPASNVVLLFALAEATCHAFEEAFGQVRYTSALTPVLQHFAQKGLSTTTDKRLFVYTHDGVIDVMVLNDCRLVMLNTYMVRTLTDVDYYVFNLARHLMLNMNETPVFVAGIPTLRDPVIEELQKYAARVYSVNPSAEFNRSIVSTTEGVPYDLMCALLK